MKKAMLIVDMQNDFISGALGTKAARAIVEPVCARIREAREKGGYWFACTQDTHGAEYLHTQEGQKLPIPHCIKGTQGWEIHPDIRAALPADTAVIEKDGFGSLALAQVIPEEIRKIEMFGLCTDICVIVNAMLLKAAFPETRITINGACSAGVTPESHQTALNAMAACQIDIC